MCGVFGIQSRDPRHFQHAQAQLAAIRHRGPDAQGFWADEQVFLGSCRLSIIDLAGGCQPIFNETRTCCIVFNGEIYNFNDLRPELERRGHRFYTETDTEVILHAYEEWGAGCLERLNGMFAFAIWDGNTHSLFIARDRIGEKPLYYYHDQRRLVFASEIKAIIADPTIPRRIDLASIANFLAFGHSLAPQTIFQDIYKLLPGHYLMLRHDRLEVAQYWDVGVEPQLGDGCTLSEEQYGNRILALLDDSVRRRMVADVPVGAFLSGGVDSSAIVALMRRHAGGPVKTFSLGFTLGGAYNELAEAADVARHFGTEHYELAVQDTDLVQVLRTLVYHYDEPFADPAGFPVYLLSQFARQHVKVVLTGEGGDELFGGYRRYAMEGIAATYQHLPDALTTHLIPATLALLPRLRRLKRAAHALSLPDPAQRYANWLVLFSPEMQEKLWQTDLLQSVGQHDPSGQYPAYYARLGGQTSQDHLNRIMYIDLKTWLPDAYLEKVDKATMACSLEARLPLLDHRLVELAFQIPSDLKIRGLSTKRILKRAVRQLVPADVLRRPKHGFAVPTDPWFRGSLKQFTFDLLFDPRTQQRGYFDMDLVRRLWREHLQGRHTWDMHLWLLLNLELWHRIYIDGESV